MFIKESLINFSSREDAYLKTHYTYEPVKQQSTISVTQTLLPSGKWKRLSQPASSLLYAMSHAFPVISVLHEPAGLFLRASTDFYQLCHSRAFFPCLKTVLSLASLTGSYFSEIRKELAFLKQIELFRSIMVRAEILYKVYQDPSQDSWGLKKSQQGLHLLIDLINMGIGFSNKKLLDLKLFSLVLQLIATVLDYKEQEHEKSYLGMSIQVILGMMRTSNIFAVASEWREMIHNSDKEEVVFPERGPLPQMIAHMNEKGTASEELSKFQVVKHLGSDRFHGDRFLVKDENEQTFVLKRFFTAKELAEKFFGGNIRFAQEYEKDLPKWEIGKTLEISENLNDSNIVKAIKVIKNCYIKVSENTQESETQTDTYLLMEHFEGTPIGNIDPTNSHFPSYFQSIVNTLVNLSGLNYFFDPRVGHTIQVDPTTDQIKFTSFNHFHKMITDSNSWKGCIKAYDCMYNFFLSLIQLSEQKNKEELLEKIKEIFSYNDLVKHYNDTKIPISEETLKQCSEIFTIDFLKKVLKQVQELFTLADPVE